MEIILALVMSALLQAAPLRPVRPERIVSTTLMTDEITAALVDSSRIVAMSPFASDPFTSNVSETARKINRFVDRNAEQIIALNPDVVLSTRYSKIDLRDLIQRAGIPYRELQQFESLGDLEANIRTVAKILGEAVRGEELIRGMRTKLETAARDLPVVQRTWRVLYLAPGEWTAGTKTTIHEVVVHAGLKDAAAEAGIVGNNKIGAEKIIAIDPDVIVVGTGYARDADYAKQLTTDPRFASMHAITLHRVVAVPSRYLLTTSQFIGDASVELSHRVQALPH